MTQFSLEMYERKFKMLHYSELSILILCKIINSELQSIEQHSNSLLLVRPSRMGGKWNHYWSSDNQAGKRYVYQKSLSKSNADAALLTNLVLMDYCNYRNHTKLFLDC